MGVSKLKFGGVLVNSVTTNSLTTHKVRINGNLVYDDSATTHVVTFSCTNGSVSAMVDGVSIQSGDRVEEGKTVVFTITPERGYQYEGANPESVVVSDDVTRTYMCIPYTTWTGLKTVSVSNSTISFNLWRSPSGTWDIEYSLDGGYSWLSYTLGTTISLSTNRYVCWRGTKDSTAQEAERYRHFSMTGSIAASGDVTSLLNGVGGVSDLTPYGNYTFCNLFKSCTSLTTAPSLPATTLAPSCYSSMFSHCWSLRSVPTDLLPATTLASWCYSHMFDDCRSLTLAPTLPAITLASSCYMYMFNGCTSLTTAPDLPVTTLSERCYSNMFNGCTSLTTAPSLPATTLASYCYNQMFSGCTSLTTAPSLPATTLEHSCYDGMFRGCTSLTTAPSLPATTLKANCYQSMFSGCTSLTTAPSLPATTLAYYCYPCMFQNCTGLTSAPTLPATTLASNCYQGMFNGCTSLTTAPDLPVTTLSEHCYQYMFQNCTSLTSAPSLPASVMTEYCYSSMFQGCTSLTSAPNLSATTMAQSCYAAMFYGCTSLTGPVNISATSPYPSGTTSACSNMFTKTGTSRPSTPTDYNKIKVGGNVSLWNSTNAGIDSTYWTVELITEGDIEEQ